MSLSARIMNLPVAKLPRHWSEDAKWGYAFGHHGACKAAAELADEADAIRDELVAALEGCMRWFPAISTLAKMGLDTATPLRDIERARAALARAKGQQA